mmetsp:Transcript_80055/g.117271  ORF Transcript_80055/g.117271 Transcript_80055/m.117271 type:complete len:83 (+) Transcript_80055:3-251(+)
MCVCVRVRVCVCISYVCARFCKRALFLQGSFPNKIFHFLEYHSDISTLSLFDFDLSVFISTTSLFQEIPFRGNNSNLSRSMT